MTPEAAARRAIRELGLPSTLLLDSADGTTAEAVVVAKRLYHLPVRSSRAAVAAQTMYGNAYHGVIEHFTQTAPARPRARAPHGNEHEAENLSEYELARLGNIAHNKQFLESLE